MCQYDQRYVIVTPAAARSSQSFVTASHHRLWWSGIFLRPHSRVAFIFMNIRRIGLPWAQISVMANIFLKMGHTWPLFRIFSVFSKKLHYNFYKKSMWKISWPTSIWRQDSNSRPLKHESSPITTIPGSRPLMAIIYSVTMRGQSTPSKCFLMIHFLFWSKLLWLAFWIRRQIVKMNRKIENKFNLATELGRGPGLVVIEETYFLKVVGSNPSTIYWMEI